MLTAMKEESAIRCLLTEPWVRSCMAPDHTTGRSAGVLDGPRLARPADVVDNTRPFHAQRRRMVRGKSALFVAILACPVTIAPLVAAPAIEKSVVRIVNHAQRPSWYTPWGTGAMQWTTGSGFVIESGLIMTNAHVVSDSRFLALFLYGDPNPHEGRVVVEGHDCDLALIRPVEANLLDGVPALPIGGLPPLRPLVATHGYPSGGAHISSPQGFPSRLHPQSHDHPPAD